MVDKRRGLLLTNRHVVKPGPVVADAVFKEGQSCVVVALNNYDLNSALSVPGSEAKLYVTLLSEGFTKGLRISPVS